MKPQEKLYSFGVEALTLGELLSLVVRIGQKGKSSLKIGEELVPLIKQLRRPIP